MIIKRSLLAILLSLCSITSYAQKESTKSFTVEFTIDPLTSQPENPVTYSTVISTPIDPLTADEEFQAGLGIEDGDKYKAALEKARGARLNELKNTHMSISGAKFIPYESKGDWTLSLVTSDVEVTFVNEKPMAQLSLEDDIFRYKYSAVLTTKDNTGKILWERILVNADEEQKMTKSMVILNPGYKIKAQLYKNNPEKLKKFSDKILEKKNHFVLYEIMDKADKAIMDNYETQVKNFVIGVFSVKGKAYEELNMVSDKIFDTNMKFHALNKKNRLPKESMDQVMRDGILVWEKYLSRKSELEEKAAKGLLLNSALASSWLGDFDKAASYLDQVPEAKKSEVKVEDIEDTNDGPPVPMGATVILSFSTYAGNTRDMFEIMKEYKNRVTIFQ